MTKEPELTRAELQAIETNLIEQLHKEFPAECIRQRKGQGGIELDYIPGSRVIKRLNKLLGLKWSFRINDQLTKMDESEVLVFGTITITDYAGEWSSCERSDCGSGEIAKNKDGSIGREARGNAYKAAVTDCLKRCARQFGVGLHLYAD